MADGAGGPVTEARAGAGRPGAGVEDERDAVGPGVADDGPGRAGVANERPCAGAGGAGVADEGPGAGALAGGAGVAV